MPFAGELYEKTVRVGFWTITESEAELRAGITLSPASMALVNSTGNQNRRFELLAVRALMHRMGISDNDLYYEKGKPLLHSGRFISISHSGAIACVAISNEEPMGIDVQELKSRLQKVVKWLMRGREKTVAGDYTLIRSGLLWAAKEAMFKLRGGQGILMRDFEANLPADIPPSEGYFTGLHSSSQGQTNYDIFYRVMEGYVFTLAVQQNNETHIGEQRRDTIPPLTDN